MSLKALQVIGISSALRFLSEELLKLIFALSFLPPLRTALLRLLGAHIGKGCIIHRFEFINFYRGSFKNLSMGNNCFIGNNVLFDLADTITLGNHVTLAERVCIMTHMNVGYPDHPLQTRFPSFQKPVTIEHGSFVGVNATILAGVHIGPQICVAAGAVVTKSFEGNMLIGGVPAISLKVTGTSDPQV